MSWILICLACNALSPVQVVVPVEFPSETACKIVLTKTIDQNPQLPLKDRIVCVEGHIPQ